MRRIRAVIFDMDGVLIDSVPFYVGIFRKVLGRHGVRGVKPKDIANKLGAKSSRIFSEILKERGKNADDDTIASITTEFRGEVHENLEKSNGFEFVPGVAELVESLRTKKVKVALGTGASRKSTDIILRKNDAKALFDVVVTGDDVERAKPEPDIFLKVAKKLRIEPEACVVVEDGLYGIGAAKKANMKCIAIMGTISSKKELEKAGADFVVENVIEVGDVLWWS